MIGKVTLVLVACCLVFGTADPTCQKGFLPVKGTDDTCYLPVPNGNVGGSQTFCFIRNMLRGQLPPIGHYDKLNICYYVIGNGEPTFPEGCCTVKSSDDAAVDVLA